MPSTILHLFLPDRPRDDEGRSPARQLAHLLGVETSGLLTLLEESDTALTFCAQAEAAPAPQPTDTEFYDATQVDVPNTPSLGRPTENKSRILLSAAYGTHEIEVRRSHGLTELIVDGKVYGRQEGVLESAYTITARVNGHIIETELTPSGKQFLRVDGQVIAKKQRLH